MRKLLRGASYSVVAWVVLAANVVGTAFVSSVIESLVYNQLVAGVALGLMLAFGIYIGAAFSGDDDGDE
jgi:hypothetical protein